MKRIIPIVLLLLGCLASAEAATTTYHVGKSGSDANSCATSSGSYVAGNARLTLAGGIACLQADASAGDDVLQLHVGNYAERIYTQTASTDPPSGTSWSSATVIESAGDGVVEINQAVFYEADDQYIIVRGLTLDPEGEPEPFLTAMGAHHIRVENCDITGTTNAGAVHISGTSLPISHHIEVLNNYIHHNGLDVGLDHGVYISGASDCLIEGNEIAFNAGSGVQSFDYDAVADDGNRNIIRNNYIHDNPISGTAFSPAGVQYSNGQDGLIYNNLLVDNFRGITIGVSSTIRVTTNIGVYNNAIYSSTSTGIQVESDARSTPLRNNISYLNGASQITNLGVGTSCSTNLGSGSVSGCVTSVTATSPFTNAGANDFTLPVGSPAAGAGVDLSSIFTTDYTGATRTVPWDIGAYKFVSASPSITLQTPNGGESWAANSSQTISYTFANLTGSTVDIEFDSANDGVFELMVANDTTATGSYSWTLPSSPTTLGKIRVKDSGGATNDISAAVFSITSGGGTFTKRISENTTGTKIGDISGTVDTYLQESSPTVNIGSGTEIRANKFSAGNHTNFLLKFTGLSQIPTNATVTSVTLGLYLTSQSAGGTPSIDFRRLLRDWNEGGATWNQFSSGNNWTTAGALSTGNDIDVDVSATLASIGTTTGQYYTYTVTTGTFFDDTQGMISGSLPNYGHLGSRQGTGNDSILRVLASAQGTNGNRPYLELTYSVPNATITVTEPTAVSYVFPGQSIPIRWQSEGVSGNLKVEILRETAGNLETIIASHAYNQADAAWTVTTPSCSQCLVKITSLNDPAITATSQPFRIGGSLAAFTAN